MAGPAVHAFAETTVPEVDLSAVGLGILSLRTGQIVSRRVIRRCRPQAAARCAANRGDRVAGHCVGAGVRPCE